MSASRTEGRRVDVSAESWQPSKSRMRERGWLFHEVIDATICAESGRYAVYTEHAQTVPTEVRDTLEEAAAFAADWWASRRSRRLAA